MQNNIKVNYEMKLKPKEIKMKTIFVIFPLIY